MTNRTSNSTGIGVRGGFLNLGGLALQPIPFIAPSAVPVVRVISPIAPMVAPPGIAANLQAGLIPDLRIPVGAVVNGGIAGALRNILPGLNAIQFQPINVPALRIIRPVLLNQNRPNEESLAISQLSFANGAFEPAEPHGISKLRPEIISLMDFEPLYFGSTQIFNDVGILMDVQYQARHLREQTFLRLMEGIRETDQRQELQAIQSNFNETFQKVNATADFYESTISTLESVKAGFDVKAISPNSFNLKAFKTIQDFYQTFMMFPASSFKRFSGTKVLMQMIFDARSIAENYSMNLLNLTDPDRMEGGGASLSPVNIDKTYNARNGFSFTYDTIRSFNGAVNATESTFFRRFNTSLPSSPDDRIKLLVNLFSKEVRVSRGLGKPDVIATLRQKFSATTTDGSPFDNILGGVGETIFDGVTGPKSIAALIALNGTGNNTILPFETKYIDANKQKLYIPGAAYFIESILNVKEQGNFNTEPLRNYVSTYIDTVDSATSVVQGIFDFGPTPSNLSPVATLKLLLRPVVNGVLNLRTSAQREGAAISVAEATAVAALRLSANDSELKSLLFQYVVLQLLASPRGGFFAEAIANELGGDISNLEGVTINLANERPNLRNRNELWPFLNGLGTSIQSRVNQLVNQSDLAGNARIAQARNRALNPASGLVIVGFDVDTVYGIPAGLSQSKILSGFVEFMSGLENLLGNEANNLLDSAKRTRFNALSVSTLFLVAFEAYTQIVGRYVSCDFQTSALGDNFPDMLVDTNFNSQMCASMQAIIAEPELPLPLIDSGDSGFLANGNNAISERLRNSNGELGVQHALGQAGKAAQAMGARVSDVQAGILQNQAILGGLQGVAGSRFTDAAALAQRNVNNHVNPQALLDAQAIDQSLASIASKLFQEDSSLACVFHIFSVIKQRLSNALALSNNYFTEETLANLGKPGTINVGDIAKNLTVSQVRLLLRERDGYLRQITANSQDIQFIPGSPTDSEIKNALLSLLSKEQYRETQDAAFRQRLLTIGIPSGFGKNLAERVDRNNITSTTFERGKEFDVITINIYKRSLEYPQLVFKPQKFLFDLSLFSNGYKNLKIQGNENFDRVLQRISLLDYQNFIKPSEVTLEDVVNDNKYDFLLAPSRRNMVENHILSDLFAAYIQALTTMRLDESTFANHASVTWKALSLGDGTDLTPRFSALVRQYLILKREGEKQLNPTLASLPDVSIEEMLRSPTVDQTTKDTLRLLTFGNIAFKAENAFANLLSPKLFDRVFTIPVNVDSFEIDQKATEATESGREFLGKKFIQENLDHHALTLGVLKLRPRSNKDTVFEDFFVTIELVQ